MNDTAPPSTTSFRDTLGQAREVVRRTVGEARSRLEARPSTVRDRAETVRHRVDRTMRRVERQMRRTSHEVRRTADDVAFELGEGRQKVLDSCEDLAWQADRVVRAHPVRALLGAFAVGFLVGFATRGCSSCCAED